MNSEENTDLDFFPLDTEWIQEFEKIVDEGIYYPRESMSFVTIYSFFVEKDTIIHVSKTKISLDSEQGGCRNLLDCLKNKSKDSHWMDWIKKEVEFVGSEKALELEEKRLEKRDKQFELSDVLLFNVDMELNPLDEQVDADFSDVSWERFFRAYSVQEWEALNSLDWNDSVFLFHPVNTVYFIFNNVPMLPLEIRDLKGADAEITGTSVLVEMPVSSILVSPSIDRSVSSKNKTRKVHFDMDSSDSEFSEGGEVEDSESDSGESDFTNWGKGKWLHKRKQNRRKTEKRKHFISPALIRSLFQS